MKSDLVEVCLLGKTVGLKGSLRLHNRSDFIEQYKKGAKFYDKFGNIFSIKSYEPSNSLVIFDGFDSVEKAKELVNRTLYRTIEDTKKSCKLKKDEYFYFDIIDSDIYESGVLLGKIDDILEVGAGYLLSVQTDKSILSQNFAKQFYIPYQDNFIIKVDTNSKKIDVKNSMDILLNS